MNNRTKQTMSRRDERKLARQLSNQPKVVATTMISADAEPILTHGERRTVHVAALACRAVERRFNEAVTAAVSALSRKKPQIVAQRVIADELGKAHANTLNDLEILDDHVKGRGQHLHWQRRMSKRVRIALLVVLSLLDVLAYRGAVEVVFGTGNDLAGRAESLLLAMLSIGMILLSAASGEKVRHWLDMRAEEEAGLNDPLPIRGARRELIAGMAFAGLTGLALWAGATLRMRSMEVDGNPVSFTIGSATLVFSALAALGAFVIELRWASEILDKRDRLVDTEKLARRRMDQQHNICARLVGEYEADIARVTTLWGQYNPLWNAQINACLDRLHEARFSQPSVFHPLSASVDDLVRGMIEEHKELIDPVEEIAALKLRVDDIDAAVSAEVEARSVIRGIGPIGVAGEGATEETDATAPDQPATEAAPASVDVLVTQPGPTTDSTADDIDTTIAPNGIRVITLDKVDGHN